MSLVAASVESGLGFGRVVAALEAIKALTEPRATAIPTKGASKLPPITGAGLVSTIHGADTITSSKVP